MSDPIVARDEVKKAVLRALGAAKELSLESPVDFDDEGIVLLGDSAVLDSMGFVNFLVALEEELVHKGGRYVNVVEAFSSEDVGNQPVCTIAQCINLICYRLKQNGVS